MAHLLGSKACIDSLRIDIDDLQNIVHDVIGKTGSIKCHSWKFPDKLATDVDVKDLLERYRYGRHEVDNQVSHIVLFEIIIDRLLLIIHGSWHLLHEIQAKVVPSTLDPSSTIDQQISLSIGLVVKKYWSKLLQLFTFLRQHESRRRRSSLTATAPLPSSPSTLTLEKHCQTIETSLGPCPSCAKLQECLRSHGDSISSLCHTYNLPSSLAHHRCSTANLPAWSSADDIVQWFDHQSKDVDRLSQHLECLSVTLEKTKADVDASEKLCKQQTETNHRLQKTINEVKQSKKILQESYESKIDGLKKEHEQEKLALSEQVKLLTTQKLNLEQQLKESNEECTSGKEQLDKFESTRNDLRILTENQTKSETLIKTLEQDGIRSRTELDVVKRELKERQRDLQKERIRIENMIRQEESHQAKQKLLTKSHEEVSQECESLKKQVVVLENQRDELRESLQTLQRQQLEPSEAVRIQSLMETNHHVLEEVAALKANIEQLHQQMSEREQMLFKQADCDGQQQIILTSDNLIHDMENQMRANELRIDLLRKQNDSFKTSLENFLHTTRTAHLTGIAEERQESGRDQSQRRHSLSNEVVTPKPKQAPLWLLNSEIIERQQQAFTETRPVTRTNSIPRHNDHHHSTSRWIISTTDVNVETLSHQSHHSNPTALVIPTESRPPPAGVRSSRSALTLPASSDHSKTRSTNLASNRPATNERARQGASIPKTTRNVSSAKTQRLTLNVTHRCPNCHTTYDDKRNYDMHKLYCRT